MKQSLSQQTHAFSGTGMNRARYFLLPIFVAITAVAGLILLLHGPEALFAAIPAEMPGLQTGGVTRYVQANGLETGDCTTQATACTLAYAVSQATAGDELLVAGGLYTVPAGADEVLSLTKSITLTGGYDGNEAILDAQAQFQKRVVLIQGSVTPVLEGFTIRNGNADFGAGIAVLAGANPLIHHNKIYGNDATHNASNLTEAGGGGIYVGGGATIAHNEIYSNSATYKGAGIFTDGDPTLIRTIAFNHIYNNSTQNDGGGLALEGIVVVDGNVVHGNTAVRGAGVYLNKYGGNIRLQNNMLYQNRAVQSGGGIGTGILLEPGAALVAEIWHNTIVSNVVTATNGTGGGLYWGVDLSLDLRNTIVASNTAVTGSGIYSDTAGAAVTGGFNNLYNNTANITLADPIVDAPHFRDEANFDLRLSLNSTAHIDAADNSVPVITDFEEDPRPCGNDPDVGADEYCLADPAYSSVAVAPGVAFANGTDAITVTVTVRNSSRLPLAGRMVDLQISNPNVNVTWINGQQTGADGAVTAVLTSTTPLTATLQAVVSSDGVTLPPISNIAFLAEDDYRLQTIAITISNGLDDAGHSHLSCFEANNHNEIYFGYCDNGNRIISGLRFPGVTLPAGAVLADARLAFTASDDYGNAMPVVRFYGEASPNSPNFSGRLPSNVTARTAAHIEWLITGLWDGFPTGYIVQTPSLYPIVDEIMRLGGWVNGNPILLLVEPLEETPPNHRRVVAEDFGIYDAARLVLTVAVPRVTDPQLSTLAVTPTVAIADGADILTATAVIRDDLGPLANREVNIASDNPQTQVAYPYGSLTDVDGRVIVHLTGNVPHTATLEATVLDDGITLDQTVVVTFTDVPITGLAVQNDSPTDLNGTTLFTATISSGTNVVYVWDFADGLTVSGSSPLTTHVYANTGQYTAVITAYNSVSQISVTTPVTVYQSVSGLTAVNDSPTVLNNTTTLTAAVTAGSDVVYLWDLGDAVTTTLPITSHLYPAIGQYTAVVTARNEYSQLSASTLITITDEPLAGLTASNDSPTVLNNSTTFTATITGGTNPTFLWDFGDGQSGSGPNPSHTYTQTGDYTAVVTASNTANQMVAQTAVYVRNAVIDPTLSQIAVTGGSTAAADGQDTIAILVTALDDQGQPVPNAQVTLTATTAVTFTQPPTTDANGRATGTVSHDQVGVVTIGAVIDGQPIAATVNVTFVAAELAIDKTGPAEAVNGFPITYTLHIANQGLLTASNIIITDSLPAQVSYSGSSIPPTSAVGGEIVWTFPTLAPGTTISLTLTGNVAGALPNNTPITNDVVVTQSGDELNLNDNQDALTSNFVQPYPILTVAPYQTLLVEQGSTDTLVIDVRNTGTNPLANAVIANPSGQLQSWIDVSPTSLGTIPHHSSAPVTVTAVTNGAITPGYYRNLLTADGDEVTAKNIYLTVRVHKPFRDLQITVINDRGLPVANAIIALQSNFPVVTDGVPQSGGADFFWQGTTDENGILTFPALESDRTYQYTVLEAPFHELGSGGSFFVSEGTAVHEESIVLTALPALQVYPEAVVFPVTAGDSEQRQLVLYNHGATPITGITVTGPANIPFVFLGQPPANATIPPGGDLTLLVNAAPLFTETLGIYAGQITVNADDGLTAVVPLTLTVHDGNVRNLHVEVLAQDGYYAYAFPNATVILENLHGQVIVNGTYTETFNQTLVEQTDIDGNVWFNDLIPGPYRLTVQKGGTTLATKEVEVIGGTGDQLEIIYVEDQGLITTFSVQEGTIPDFYTTIMTMTFIPHARPRVTLTPRHVNLCGAGTEGITETLTIHNFYNVEFSNVQVNLETYGNVRARLSLADGSSSISYEPGQPLPGPLTLGTIPRNSHAITLTLNAQLLDPVCAERSQGGVHLQATGDWVHSAPQAWYGFVPGQTPGMLQPTGTPFDIPLGLRNDGYPAEANMNGTPPDLVDIILTPPQNLDWMGIDTTYIPSLTVGSVYTFNLVVTPTQWLPPGTYFDHILLQATNGITALIGIEAEMTPQGMSVETNLITPLYASAGSGGQAGSGVPFGPPLAHGRSPGLANMTSYLPPEQAVGGGDLLELVWQSLADLYNEDPTVTLLDENWELNVGCFCGISVTWHLIGGGLVYVVGGGGGASWVPRPHGDFKENVVILRLEQRFSFEREAFFAQLDLTNGSFFTLTDFTVDLFISHIDPNGQLQQVIQRLPGQVLTPTTTFIPNFPLTSTLISTQTLQSQMPGYWTEIPPVNFVVIPEEVNVPDLPPRYLISPTNPFIGSHTVNWTIVPDAFGLEENEQKEFFIQAVINYKKNGIDQPTIVTTDESIWVNPQPRLMLDYFVPNFVLGGQTFDWVVVVTNLGYGAARNFRIETPQPEIIQQSELYPTTFTLVGEPVIEYGDLGPGDQFIDAWRIIPSRWGSFVDWEATCVHENYMGVELPPLMSCVPNIHVINTAPPAPESQQWGKDNSCLVGSYQGFDSDPVNTFSGNFTYSDMDVNIPSWGPPLEFERSYNSRETEDGPLGPGWTHNYNMWIERNTWLPLGGSQGDALDIMKMRLPHGSWAFFEIDDTGPITAFVPFPGVRADLVFDNAASEYRLTRPNDQTVYTFNLTQTLKSIEDANGNRLTFTYFDQDLGGGQHNYYLKDATDPAGRQLVFTYTPEWRLETMTDPLGRTYSYSYINGYLTAVTDFRSQTTQYTYTSPDGAFPDLLGTIVDANNHTEVTNHYNDLRQVEWQEDALGNRTTFTYLVNTFANTRITAMLDPRGNLTTDVYDGDGRLIERYDTNGFYESYQYNDDNNMTSLVDKNGHTTTYEWNTCGCDITRIIDPMLNETVMTYNANNQVTSIEDERDYLTTIEYDAFNNPITTTTPAGQVVRVYGAHGELLAETNENGTITTYGYDAYGNTTVITDALDNRIYMAYDLAGRLLASTDALTHTTTYTYDAGDNLLALHAPLGVSTFFSYDNVGNLRTTTDAEGRVTTYTYNARNEQIRITDALSGTQLFTYDEVGNMAAAADENGRTTTYGYDGLNRVVTITNALGGVTSYTYDPVGNRLTERDPNGNLTRYVYDDNDRRTDTIFPDGTSMHATYDEADNMLTLTDAEGRTVTYTYDALGRTETKTDPAYLGTNSGTTIFTYDAVGNQTHVTDPEGRVTAYAYDALNRLVTVTNPLSGTTVIGYDAVGNRLSLTDANGRTATFAYDELNRLVQITDPLTGTTTFAYDKVGNQIQVVDPLLRVTQTAYDALNRPVTVTNALSGTIVYSYDAAGNVLRETDEEDRSTTFAYDALHRTIFITDTLGGVTALAYDANGNLLSRTDPENRTTVYVYDEHNQLIRLTDPLTGTTHYDYDDVGNLVRLVDANGHATTYRYDGLDRIIEVTDALTQTTTYAYDKVGNLLTLTDAENNITTSAYDALNRVVTMTQYLGAQAVQTVYDYDAVGNVLAVTDPETRVTTFIYDTLDRLVQVTDPLSQTTRYDYDAVGNQIQITDAKDRATTFAYDGLNRLVTMTNTISGTTVFTYSAASNLVSTQNPLAQVTQYHYDALNRLQRVIDPASQVISYTYDAVGNVRFFTDAAGRVTEFHYDDLNRLATVIDPLQGVTRYGYDAAGNQTSLTNAENQTIRYAYDPVNRLVMVTDPLTHTTQFIYDAVGNQIHLIDPLSRTITYTYDSLYRLEMVQDADGNPTVYGYDLVGNQTSITDAESRQTVIAYDALNRPITISDALTGTSFLIYDETGNLRHEIDAEGRVYTYTYDLLDRLTTVTDPLGHATTYRYDHLGNLLSLTDALSRTTTYGYDALNRLITITNPLTGTTAFSYDPVGNLLCQTDPLQHVTCYQYDALDRVIAETNALTYTTVYTYDAIGNLRAVMDANNHTVQLTYDPLNRLRTVTDPLQRETTYQYDAVGNHTFIFDPLQRVTQFEYNNRNLLVRVTDPLSRTTSYAYDRVGNQTSMTDAEGVTTRYVYDPLNRLSQVIENYRPGNPADVQTNVTTQFGYDGVGNLTRVTNPLQQDFTFAYDPLNRLQTSRDPWGHTAVYTYDPVGNLQQVLDPNSQTTAYTYDALNRLTAVTRPDEVVRYGYDAVGNRRIMTDTTGVTTYEYDALYRLTAVTDPFNQAVGYDYDPVGNRTRLVYPGSDDVDYVYDAANRLRLVTDWADGVTQYDYDEVGRLVEMVLPNGITSTYQYDAGDQLIDIQHLHPVTGVLASYAYGYDLVGNRTQAIEMVTSPDLTAPTAIFTATPRLGVVPLDVTFSNASADADEFTWDFGDGTLLTTTQQTPLTHTYSTNGVYTVTLTARNEQFTHVLMRTSYILVVPADAFVEIDGLAVMEAENAHVHTPRSSQAWLTATTLSGYVGAAYQQVLPDVGALYLTGTVTTASPELQYQVTFANPGLYRVWVRGAAVDPAGDSLHIGLNGVVGSTAVDLTGFRFNEWTWSAQTAVGLASVTIPEPGVYTITVWAREDGLRVDRLLLTSDMGFTPSGAGPAESPRAGDVQASLLPHLRSTVANELTINRDYVRALRQQQAWAEFWANVLANPGSLALAPLAFISPLAYNQRRRKKMQRVTTVLMVVAVAALGVGLASAGGLGAVSGGQYSVFSGPLMDAEWRESEYALQTSSTTTIDYTYDDLYRLTDAVYDTGQSFGYSYDAAGNRLSHSLNGSPVMTYTYDVANRLVQTHDLVTSAVTNFSYDNNGNLLDDGAYTYTYDSANRLTGLADGVSVMSYVYNGDGVRVAQIVDGLRTDYVQDIATPLPQVLTARQGGTVSQYLQGLGLIGEERAGSGGGASPPTWQFHLPDAIGSVRQIADAQGAVTLARSYDPFGGLLASDGPASSAYGFAGEEQDPATEHLYLRARTYNPANGRFLQQDSVLGQTNQPRTLHRYTYAFNNPVNYTDPSGHMPPTGGGTPPANSGGSSPEYVGGPPIPFPDIPGGICRSVNCDQWETWSNEAERLLSEGFRAAQCGMALVIRHLPGLQRIADGFHSVASKVVNTFNRTMAKLNDTLDSKWGYVIGGAIIVGSIILTGGASIPIIIGGAVIGAGIGYGLNVWENRQEGMNWGDALTKVDLSRIGQAAFHGAVSGAVAGIVSAALPVASASLGWQVAATAGVELISGRLEQIAVNVVSGRHWAEDVWNPRSGNWWRDVALDVLPGVGATMFKPALKGLRGGLSDAADRWRLTQRLDDYVTRGTPINPLNRFKAKIEPYQALASQVMKGIPGVPGRLASILRGADRTGWKAFWQAGMQPDYITRLNRFAQANDLEIGIRASKRMALFWRLFDLPAKPLTVKTKTRFGIVRGADGIWYRSDMDLGYIRNLKQNRVLRNDEVIEMLDDLNGIAGGNEFQHPTHWTYSGLKSMEDPHPGDLYIINNPDIPNGRFVKRQDAKQFADNNGLPWVFDGANDPITYYRVQGGTGKRSKMLITINQDGNVRIKNATLNISTGSRNHANYYLSEKRPGGVIVRFDVPRWLHNFIYWEGIPQHGATSNPLNQGGSAPKIVDPTKPPGQAHEGVNFELPAIWAEWLEEYAIPGSGSIIGP